MSKFTMQVRDAIIALGGTVTFDKGLMVVTGDIGLSNYPIFDEAYRNTLNSNILRHYYMHEIGVETPELWRFNMESDMILNMPYFNEVYKTTVLDVDPLSTINIETVASGASTTMAVTDTTTSAVTENEAGSRDVQSTFPQNMLSGSGDYASAGADGKSTSRSDVTSGVGTTGNESGTSDNNSTVKGYQGNPGDILTAYRAALLNVDRSVIMSLEDNFMQVWDAGDRFSDRNTFERYTP